MVEGDLDFRALFEGSPDILLVLLPDAPRFTMVAATESRLAATHTTREGTIGKGLFEVFPDNPEDPSGGGTSNLRASLERVIATRAPDTMAVQKYDIRGADGRFETKYWSPKNLPVLSPSGEIRYILHRVEDVTELVRASELGESLRDKTHAMEREVIARSRELHAANAKLRETNAKLGELDIAKTAFFSNVSHEFRTPLTLMLGPLEDTLADRDEPLGERQRARLQLVRDNSLRLLKLVNALLDFARLEAGRMHASFAPVDIGLVTAELAGMFQSAIERADLRFVIDCPQSPEPAFVDREMWEKIVTNLVSNALKFTLKGEIAVRTRTKGGTHVLEVVDTGVGIPEGELGRVFERFHRVAGTTGRTQEGTGIGLALVSELTALNGGKVSVESTLGKGTKFRVELPTGHAHLPADAVSHEAALELERGQLGRDAAAHQLDVRRWVDTSTDPVVARGERAPTSASPTPSARDRAHVLLVDDNADLRRYISDLLSTAYEVTTATDGRAALEAIAVRRPDIVVSDVMMPVLDGVGLLRELRANPSTSTLPVILLSARAGDDAAVLGLDAGSDDYLVKPFSARELLARVRTHVALDRTRRAWAAKLELANKELEAFNYSVSHDLRTPVRAIDGFAQALAEDYTNQLDATGRSYLARILKGAQRMKELIEALLGLSRLSLATMETAPVDLSTLAGGIIEELRRAHPERVVETHVEPGLVAHGDRRLLHVVLSNLIGNAWKFTSKLAEARIDVGRAHDRDRPFFVRDTGAGFDPAFAQRLFAPFQRLHSADEFEGTGIGLATVRRVVARHGGRIWADATPGGGATFSFTLADEDAGLAH